MYRPDRDFLFFSLLSQFSRSFVLLGFSQPCHMHTQVGTQREDCSIHTVAIAPSIVSVSYFPSSTWEGRERERESMTASNQQKGDEAILEVPIIDLSSLSSLSSSSSPSKDDDDVSLIVQQIAKACTEYGFFHVTGHGIDPQLVQDYIHQCQLYFDLPHHVKLQWKRNEGNARGYFDDELTKQRRDWKEAFDFGIPQSRDWSIEENDDSNVNNHCMDGWNQFPSSDILPDFRRIVTTYFDECAKLSHRLTVLMALGLNQDENSPMVQDLLHTHSSYLRVNYYPPYDPTNNQNDNPNEVVVVPSSSPSSSSSQQPEPTTPLGISPHTDAGFLTVLWQDENCHSLQVWKNNQWITATPVPNAFTINTGDMAQVWSNGQYQAPLHRVLTNSTKKRYSAPFFYNPSYNCRVEPLIQANKTMTTKTQEETPQYQQQPQEEKAKAKYHPILWGYFRAVRFAGDLTDLGVEIQIEHFLKDQNENNNNNNNSNEKSDHLAKQEVFAKEANFKVPFSVEKYRPLLVGN